MVPDSLGCAHNQAEHIQERLRSIRRHDTARTSILEAFLSRSRGVSRIDNLAGIETK